MEIIEELWLCVDCTIVDCNGDYSGMSEERAREVNAGFARLSEQYPKAHVSPNFDSNANEDEESGIREFSWCGCDCCGSRLGGTFHRFAILGEAVTP